MSALGRLFIEAFDPTNTTGPLSQYKPGFADFMTGTAAGGQMKVGQGIRSAAIAKLLQQAQAGDQQATSTLMEGLATRLKGMANRFSRRHAESARGQIGDLINVGNEEILKRMTTVDPAKTEIEPSLLYRAKVGMNDYLGKNKVANLPEGDRQAYGRIRQFEKQWAGAHPNSPVPSDELVAMKLFAPRKASPSAPDISPQANRDSVEMVRRLRAQVPSLKGVSLEKLPPSGEREELSVFPAEVKDTKASVTNLFDKLNPRERQIVEGYYNDVSPKTDADLAKELGISSQRVGQLRKKAIDKLKSNEPQSLGAAARTGPSSPEEEWHKNWRIANQENILQKRDITEAGGDPTDIDLYTDPRYGQGFTNLPPRSISAATQAASDRLGVGRLRMPPREPDPNIVRQLQAKQSLSQFPASQEPMSNIPGPWERDRASANEVERVMRNAGYRWTPEDSGMDTPGMPLIRSEQPPISGAHNPAQIPRPIFGIKGEEWNRGTPGNESIDIVGPGTSPSNMTPDQAVSWLRQLRRDAQRFRQQRGSEPPDVGGM